MATPISSKGKKGKGHLGRKTKKVGATNSKCDNKIALLHKIREEKEALFGAWFTARSQFAPATNNDDRLEKIDTNVQMIVETINSSKRRLFPDDEETRRSSWKC